MKRRPNPATLKLLRFTPQHQAGLRDLVAWVNPPDSAWLVEVGSYAGESSAIFANSGRFGRVTCVDPWATPGARLAERYFDLRARHYPLEKLRGSSLAVAAEIEDASVDMVYIDALHDFVSVAADIRAWLPKVRSGGVIAGHDYVAEAAPVPDERVEASRYWPGVIRAVDEAFGRPDATFVDDSWAVRL